MPVQTVVRLPPSAAWLCTVTYVDKGERRESAEVSDSQIGMSVAVPRQTAFPRAAHARAAHSHRTGRWRWTMRGSISKVIFAGLAALATVAPLAPTTTSASAAGTGGVGGFHGGGAGGFGGFRGGTMAVRPGSR